MAFTFDMDADSILHLDHHASADTRIATMSFLRYGPLVAIPRILNLYQRYGLRQTFFIPAWCMERYGETVELILKGGHEIAYHGYLHERFNELTAEKEEYWLGRGIEAFVSITGSRPKGIRVPSSRFSRNTLPLLLQEGFEYDSSLMGDDVPYLLKSSQADLIELPYLDEEMDDWAHFMRQNEFSDKVPIKSPKEGYRVFREEFDAAWKYGALWVAVLHPFLSGRLARMDAFEELLKYMLEKGNVWFAPLEEIAGHVRSCIADGSWTPRTDQFPYYDGPIPELGPAQPTEAC